MGRGDFQVSEPSDGGVTTGLPAGNHDVDGGISGEGDCPKVKCRGRDGEEAQAGRQASIERKIGEIVSFFGSVDLVLSF